MTHAHSSRVKGKADNAAPVERDLEGRRTDRAASERLHPFGRYQVGVTRSCARTHVCRLRGYNFQHLQFRIGWLLRAACIPRAFAFRQIAEAPSSSPSLTGDVTHTRARSRNLPLDLSAVAARLRTARASLAVAHAQPQRASAASVCVRACVACLLPPPSLPGLCFVRRRGPLIRCFLRSLSNTGLCVRVCGGDRERPCGVELSWSQRQTGVGLERGPAPV